MYQNTINGMRDALSAAGGDGRRLLIDGDVIRVMPAEPTTVPQEVTMRQAQRALLDAGLLDAVEAAINALPEPPRRAAKIDWEMSSTMRRDSQFVQLLAPALGMTSTQLDALFVAASKLAA